MTTKGNKRGRPFKLHPNEVKHWTDKYGDEYSKVRAILFVNSAVESGLINEEDEFAVYLLFNSIESRIKSCTYGEGIYEGVPCEWTNVHETCTDIITKKPDFWHDYCEMTKNFIKQGQRLAYRPTIDRINNDPAIGYTLDNIAVLSHGDNAKKALSKPHYVFEMSLQDPFNLQNIRTFSKFETKGEAVKSLGLKFKSDNGRVYEVGGKTYLIQSEDITLGYKDLDESLQDDETELMSAWIPVGIVENDEGVKGLIRQEITFPALVIKIKDEAQ